MPAATPRGTAFQAILVAAGRGRRMGAAEPKQILPLAGRAMLEHSLRAFERCDDVAAVTLVAPPELESHEGLELQNYPKLVSRVDGGKTRQESVWLGLSAIRDGEWVVVHDAARPLVSDELIDAVLQAALCSGAAIPACRVSDTIKRAEGEAVIATLDREGMLLVQTPQAFRLDLLRQAHALALRDGFQGTDDSHLVERLGEPVTWVEGTPLNLKVTTPDDLVLAEALLRSGAVRGPE